MPTIKLNDRFGLDVNIQPAPLSAFTRYFQGLPALVAEGADLKTLGGLSLSDPAITSLQTGLSFAEPVEIGREAPKLTVQAGVQGSFSVIAGGDNTLLFAPDDYGDNIAIPGGACYVAVALTASAGASVAGAAGSLGFGAQSGAAVAITNYRQFPARQGPPTLLDALKESVAGFVLPASAGDLQAIPEGGVVTVDTQGSLKLSGTANLLAAVNPLATVELPSPLPALGVKGGASVQVGASFQVTGAYQIRAHRLDRNRVLLGWYRKHGAEVDVKAGANAGISANFGTTDLFSSLITAISGNAQADLKELQHAGLSSAEIATIQAAVTAAVDRKLELALSFELGALASDQAAFLYEVDLSTLADDGVAAIGRALASDLSGLCADETLLPAGIRTVRSIFTAIHQGKHTLTVSLLGIYNYISLSKLTLAGKVMVEPATGTLVITDTATADRVRSAAVNFGADADKLRHVLAESFLITAAYRGSRSVVSPPALKSSHLFFDLHDHTGPDQMRADVAVGAALGLVPSGIPQGVTEFGRTSVYAETQYDDALTSALFLDSDGRPRAPGEYENAGRGALQLLVPEGGDQAYRRRPAIDDGLWTQMKATGQPGFAGLFPRLNTVAVGVLTADYTTIMWWATAMRETAEHLSAMRGQFPANPSDPQFQKLRAGLAEHLKEVAANTREEFGQPWGMVAMDLVSGRRADARILITGSRLALSAERPRAVAAG